MGATINPQSVIELCQKLVQCKTLIGDEQAAADLLGAEMQALNYDQVIIDTNGSVVGVIEGGKPGPTLLFDSHIDTVGITSLESWRYPPFSGDVVGKRLYGRGASDMKGAAAGMVIAAASVDREEIAGRVVISASVMEEVLEGRALQTVMDEFPPDFVVICEPSDLKLVHASRGRAEIVIETFGVSGHTSIPDQGVNAVHAMLPVVEAIAQIDLPVDDMLGKGVMELTDMISSPYPGYSVIPDGCRATYDRRLVLGESWESVQASLAGLPTIPGARVEVSLVEKSYRAYTGNELKMAKWFPAWAFPRDHNFVQTAAQGLQNAGLSVEYDVYRFCTNGAFSAGVAGVPTIGFGPSTSALCHIVDEYIELDALVNAAKGYIGIIEAVLG